mmetsp:Transcript_29056/g.88858  ORF Transcript_29056/g.88858 Transcript_29056/m.88858 type:complete len:441 (-) Transcript_29056:167-1489(-)
MSNLCGEVSFSEARFVTRSADGAISVVAADVDGDGDMDIVSGSTNDDTVAWYENDGTAFEKRVITNQCAGAQAIAIADLDGDGAVDVVSAASLANEVDWWQNRREETAPLYTKQVVSKAEVGVHDVAVGDVDGDADLDVVSASRSDVVWHEATQSGSFVRHVVDENALFAMAVDVADLDGDADLDVVAASSGDYTVAWYENNNTSFTKHVLTTAAFGAVSVSAVDLDADGDVDVLAASYGDDTIAWYENDGSASLWKKHVVTTTADGAQSVKAADLDGDLDLDLLSASIFDDTVAWYEHMCLDPTAAPTLASTTRPSPSPTPSPPPRRKSSSSHHRHGHPVLHARQIFVTAVGGGVLATLLTWLFLRRRKRLRHNAALIRGHYDAEMRWTALLAASPDGFTSPGDVEMRLGALDEDEKKQEEETLAAMGYYVGPREPIAK